MKVTISLFKVQMIRLIKFSILLFNQIFDYPCVLYNLSIMQFKQPCYQKREQFQVQIRRNQRKIDQNAFRHNLLTSIFGHNPIQQNLVTMPKLVECLIDYMDDRLDSIEKTLIQFASALEKQKEPNLNFDESILGLFIDLYSKVEKQEPLIAQNLQIKILGLLSCFPGFNIFKEQIIRQYNLVEFIAEIIHQDHHALKYLLFIVNNFRKTEDIKIMFKKSQKLMSKMILITKATLGALGKKKTDSIVKNLITWWADIEVGDIQETDPFQSSVIIYNLAKEVIVNYTQYLYQNQTYTNQIYMVNALIVVERYLKHFRQQITRIPTFQFSHSEYLNLMMNSHIEEGKTYILSILGMMITINPDFCKAIVEDTAFPSLITRDMEKNTYKTIIVILNNIILNVGSHNSLNSSIQNLGLLFAYGETITHEEREMIWDIIMMWFFHPHKKQVLKHSDIKLLQIISQSTQPINEKIEILFWRSMMRMGYDKPAPEYITQMDLDSD